VSDTDARQWTLTHNAQLVLPSGIVAGQLDRVLGIAIGSEVTGPHTGDEKVTVVPIERLDQVKVEARPAREAALLEVNGRQADRIRQLMNRNSRLNAHVQRLRAEQEPVEEQREPAEPVQEVFAT
jgi:hypothetical protein